ncbi:MAG: glutathione S-transferase family protein [Alphaproteobacteria bacterium]|nr:glutathione S-transferase family protein [Alphaproteobacteria bacterium]
MYDFLDSGNGYKVRLLLSQLGIALQLIEIDVLTGETRTPEFLALNPNGRIPILVLDDGTVLSESDAILFYFAEGTPLLPDDQLDRARVLQWMFFEQYNHEPTIAVARFWTKHGEMDALRKQLLPQKMAQGYAALDVMEQRLGTVDFLVGGAYSIADIALYAYTHVAAEGGFDLAGYPAIRSWLARVAAEPGHIPITKREF